MIRLVTKYKIFIVLAIVLLILFILFFYEKPDSGNSEKEETTINQENTTKVEQDLVKEPVKETVEQTKDAETITKPTLSYISGLNVLSISDTDSVDLSNLLDNTDSQSISLINNTLQLSGSSRTSDLSSYLDNTDRQTISIDGTNTLKIIGGNSVSLSSYLDNTDILASLSCSAGDVAQWNGTAWVCATTSGVNTDNQTVSIDGSDNLSITGGNSVSLSSYIDNYSAGNGLSVLSKVFSVDSPTCAGTTKLQWDGSAFLCAADTDTVLDEATVDGYANNNGYLTSESDSIVGNEVLDATTDKGLIIAGLGTALSPYTLGLVNCDDNEVLKYATGSGIWGCSADTDTVLDEATVDGYADNNGYLTSESDGEVGNEVLNATTNKGLALAGLGTGVSPYTLGLINCADNEILKYANGSGTWSCSADADTVLDEATVDGYANNNGYLTSETDGVVGNEVLNATTNKGLALAGLGTGISPYTLGLIDCADNQILKYVNGTSTWGCATDEVGSIAADSLNYTDFSDSLSLDASTQTTLGSFNNIYNLDGTGDFIFQDNGTPILSILNTGAFQLVNSNNSTTGFTISNSGGTNQFVIDSTNSRVYIGNPTADTTGALLVLDSKNNTGDPTGVNGASYYNSALNVFRCYENGRWRNCMNSARTAYTYYNDYMGALAGDSLVYAVSGTGAANSATAVSSVADHPGVLQHATGTTATGRATVAVQAVNGILLGNNSEWRFSTSVRIPILSTPTETFTYRSGFIDATATETVDGCIFRYTDAVVAGNWQGVCRSNNTESTCDTGIAVGANTWYRLNLLVNSAGTSVDFSTDGVSRCQVTTNIPTGAGRGTGFGSTMTKSVGLTSRVADNDYIEVRGEFSTATR